MSLDDLPGSSPDIDTGPLPPLRAQTPVSPLDRFRAAVQGSMQHGTPAHVNNSSRTGHVTDRIDVLPALDFTLDHDGPVLRSDDTSIINSSPVHTKEDRIRKGRKNGGKKMQAINARKREDAENNHATHLAKEREAAETRRDSGLKRALEVLEEHGLRFADLVEYVFDKANQTREWRWNNFFIRGGILRKVLDFWSSGDCPPSVHDKLHLWTSTYMAGILKKEAKAVTDLGILRITDRVIDASFALGLKFCALGATIRDVCPMLMSCLDAVTTTNRQRAELSSKNLSIKCFLAESAAINLLGARSQRNSYARHVLGLYLYSTGASRQQVSVLNHLGLSVSYVTLAGVGGKEENAKLLTADPLQDIDAIDVDIVTSNGNGVVARDSADASHVQEATGLPDLEDDPDIDDSEEFNDKADGQVPPRDKEKSKTERQKAKPRTRRLGTLEKLSLSMRRLAQIIAAGLLFLTVYDNINMLRKVGEQIIGHIDTMQNGTCATIVPLFKAKLDDLKTELLDDSFDKAPSLALDDLKLTLPERELYNACMEHAVLHIAVGHGGLKLERFQQQVRESEPRTSRAIEVHKTDIYPLPAMDINEASTSGNAKVMEAIMKELGLDEAQITDHLKLITGDQLSIARLRAVLAAQAGNQGSAGSLRWALFVPGLFHYKMAATQGLMLTHLGLPNHDMSNPASLLAHNVMLQRKPIVATSLPPFRICRDLIFVSLYAWVLHCLLLVSGKNSVEDFGEDLTWDDLVKYAKQVLQDYTDTNKVAKLRHARARHDKDHGDMVFENAVLFLRDALLLFAFSNAIKTGDSGRVLVILKVWAFSFRGQGRTKYVQEVLFLIHNIEHVWPKAVVMVCTSDIVLNNWLVNPTGKRNAWVEVDLMQEHLNFWIKIFYAAHGSGASWEWLHTIAPCIQILRDLANKVNSTLGVKQGNRHVSLDLTDDIDELMGSLRHNNIYSVALGRVFASEDKPAADVVAEGFTSLSWGSSSPLAQFNETFIRLQKRRRIRPLVGEVLTASPVPPSLPPAMFSGTSDAETPDNNIDMDDDEDLEQLEQDLDVGVTTELELLNEEDVALDMDADELLLQEQAFQGIDDEELDFDSESEDFGEADFDE
ncbi:hypothetical protein EWM64_g6746 [Hericium alpestre]|uniref:DUF6589 domain-containing protein n=1 Tax=Hericium alpestre TaxID=135208 RepID=A0A4Y9ZUS2_9AGAM|nr:hypothetical protein EWM64_g6746 [Hericium alpestre]